jgi:hypothetical protein
MKTNTFSRIISFLIFTTISLSFLGGFIYENNNYILFAFSLICFGFGLYILLNENEDKIEKIKNIKK